jgi:hypothetical protein
MFFRIYPTASWSLSVSRGQGLEKLKLTSRFASLWGHSGKSKRVPPDTLTEELSK